MKKVTFIGHRDLYFGAESVMLRVMRFVKSGKIADVAVVLPLSNHNGFRAQIDRDSFSDIKLYRYKLIGHSFFRCLLCLLYNLPAAIVASFHLRNQKTDIIYTNTSVNIFGAMVAFLMGKPHIWHFHEQPSGSNFKWIPKRLFPLYRFLINRAHTKIIFISNTQKKLWEEEFGQAISNSEVIYTPTSGLLKTENIQHENQFPIFGFLGSLTESKNIVRLINASFLLKKAYPDLFKRLILMGDGEFASQIRAEISRLQMDAEIEIWAHNENIRPFYEAIDIFILPSLFESWGLVALEAISAKKALILTENTGLTEILTHEEDCLLVDPQQIDSIFKSMERLLLDSQLRNFIANNAYQKIDKLKFADRFEMSLTTLFR